MPASNRLRHVLGACRAENRMAMGLFLTCGFPTPEATLPILRACEAGGADLVELGMPFSDPVAEGLPIQEASERALAQGTRLSDVFATAAAFREDSEAPLVLMGYANPVLRLGVDTFCEQASAAGVDGLILPDLPPEEADELDAAAAGYDLAVTYLIAPNTPEERIRHVAERSTGFVYAVSVTGLTGSDLGDAETADAYLRRARALVEDQPLLVGFGIQTHEEASRLSRHTDGFIVGSALIREAERLWNEDALSDEERTAGITDWAHTLKHGLPVETATAPPDLSP